VHAKASSVRLEIHGAAQSSPKPLDLGVVLLDVLGGKDIVEERDGRMDEWTCWIVIGRIRVKMELHAQIRFYVLSLVNTVG
jgi:hypothetical protein